MIDRAEPVHGDHERGRAERAGEVHHRPLPRHRDQEPAHTFHQHDLRAGTQRLQAKEHRVEVDRLAGGVGRERGDQWLGEPVERRERLGLAGRGGQQRAILEQRGGVGAAGLDRLDGHHAPSRRRERVAQRAADPGLADTSVGAGDEQRGHAPRSASSTCRAASATCRPSRVPASLSNG